MKLEYVPYSILQSVLLLLTIFNLALVYLFQPKLAREFHNDIKQYILDLIFLLHRAYHHEISRNRDA